jgi:stage IV sporulation protein B
MKKHPSPLRRAVGLVLTLLLTLGYFSPTQQALRALPASLRLTQDEPISLLTGMLRASGEGLEVSASQDETLSQYVSVTGQKSGTSELLLSILGIPLRRVEVEVSPEKRLIPGGQALGVAMRTDGVLIVGLSDVKKGACPARDCGLQPGDVLLRIGGHAIERVADVSEIAQQNGTSPLLIEYMRDGTTAHATLTPVQDDATGVVRLGAWVRDSTAGIGTLSFYDPDSGQYAALGHAITDGDTGSILTVREGRVLKASIVAVQKGQRGVPGELKGSFLQNAAVLGDIAQNTTLGISGTLTTAVTNPLYPDGLPIGTRSSVHTGAATILSTIGTGGVQEYTVEITHVSQQNAPAAKSMVLRVTDTRLLDATGGIVQGMSGSPIIQDGKLIGAVTHVFVSDPTQGYGLYVDWMLSQMQGTSADQ